jgi:DNA replication licensing factor MCM6
LLQKSIIRVEQDDVDIEGEDAPEAMTSSEAIDGGLRGLQLEDRNETQDQANPDAMEETRPEAENTPSYRITYEKYCQIQTMLVLHLKEVDRTQCKSWAEVEVICIETHPSSLLTF